MILKKEEKTAGTAGENNISRASLAEKHLTRGFFFLKFKPFYGIIILSINQFNIKLMSNLEADENKRIEYLQSINYGIEQEVIDKIFKYGNPVVDLDLSVETCIIAEAILKNEEGGRVFYERNNEFDQYNYDLKGSITINHKEGIMTVEINIKPLPIKARENPEENKTLRLVRKLHGKIRK